MYAMSNKWVALPIPILELMLLMSPGKVSGIVNRSETSALQFCTEGNKDMQNTSREITHDTVCVPVSAVRTIHRRNIDMSPMDEPILFILADKISCSRVEAMLTSVTMIPAMGPKKTV